MNIDISLDFSDLLHHYKGCIGIIKRDSISTSDFFYIQGGERGELYGTISPMFPKRGTPSVWKPMGFSINSWELKNLDVSWPTLGLVHCNKGCGYIFRKQGNEGGKFKRGFTLMNVSFTHNNYAIFSLLEKRMTTERDLASPSFLRQIYFPKYFYVEDAYKLLDQGKYIAKNISKEFFLTIDVQGDYIYLGYKTDIVGIVVSPTEIHLFPQLGFLTEKLQDVFTLKNESIYIITQDKAT